MEALLAIELMPRSSGIDLRAEFAVRIRGSSEIERARLISMEAMQVTSV
jgi:hypothetical protein